MAHTLTDSRLGRLLSARRDDVNALAASFGASNVRVFGSVARGDDQPGSDVDLLVDLAPNTSLFALMALETAISDLLGVPVDIGSPESLKQSMRDRVLAEAVPL